jgi:hypothetical protein
MHWNATHGETINRGWSPEYASWKHMRQRCFNPRNRAYKYYGGRGITVCARWRDSFEAFLADMGRRPSPKHSIDRVDNDGNYEPGNCRWATDREQTINSRHARLITHSGLTLCLKDWCTRLGVDYKLAHNRIRKLRWEPLSALGLAPRQLADGARCTAIKTSRGVGQQCQVSAIAGTDLCFMHTPGARKCKPGCRCFSCVERRKREASK